MGALRLKLIFRKISASYVQISRISASYVRILKISASFIRTLKISASFIRTSKISASFIRTSKISANFVRTSKISVIFITSFIQNQPNKASIPSKPPPFPTTISHLFPIRQKANHVAIDLNKIVKTLPGIHRASQRKRPSHPWLFREQRNENIWSIIYSQNRPCLGGNAINLHRVFRGLQRSANTQRTNKVNYRVSN
jgi:hypothetical protein